MKLWSQFHNHIVAALLPLFLLCAPAFGQTPKLDDLFQRLKTADAQAAGRLEAEIWIEWSKSGSPAMDLLLDRGRKAMAAGVNDVAIEHLTALVDHAPDFAEGWNARATAFYSAGQFGPAVSDIGRVLSLNPRHFGALAGLAMIFEGLDRKAKALEVYRAVLAIHPHAAGVSDAIERLETALQGQDL
jgi:tetratricopeptide (TPR) repeat protein